MAEFKDLLGLTLTGVERIGDDEIKFTANDGRVFKLYHDQDCCESVYIESITGDLDRLIGHPITLAEEATSGENPPDAKPEIVKYQDCFTWTFYKLATIKGYVDIRWYGESNGYYSESVDFCEEGKSRWG
ncbi:DUF7448 domain-containing protein [Parapusillimonas sp. JC17]|uniref:DUF7448 domain-containing protein n=1 Tax=Parapusillimonas sp. JC17 TaxID=3445768 RepID=UPI003FA02CA8